MVYIVFVANLSNTQDISFISTEIILRLSY